MPNMQNMQNMYNRLKMTCFSWAFVLFQHRNKCTLVLLYTSVGLCMNFEQYQQLAEPDVVHPQLNLKRAIGNSRGSDKHHALVLVVRKSNPGIKQSVHAIKAQNMHNVHNLQDMRNMANMAGIYNGQQ